MEHEGERHVYLRDFGWIPDSYRSKHAKPLTPKVWSEKDPLLVTYVPRHRLERVAVGSRLLQVVR